MTKKNLRSGTTLDAVLDTGGVREAARTEVVQRLVAWHPSLEMKRRCRCHLLAPAELIEPAR